MDQWVIRSRPQAVSCGRPLSGRQAHALSWNERSRVTAVEHETTLEYSVPLLREAVAGFWRRSVGVGILIALTGSTGMLSVLFAQGDRSWVVGLLGTVITFGAACV